MQTNELVLPSKDVSGLFRGKVPDVGVGREFQLIEERQKTLDGFEPHGQLPLADSALSSLVSEAETGQHLLMMKSTSAGASRPVLAQAVPI